MEIHGIFARSQRLAGKGLLAFVTHISAYDVLPLKAQSCGSTGLVTKDTSPTRPEMAAPVDWQMSTLRCRTLSRLCEIRSRDS